MTTWRVTWTALYRDKKVRTFDKIVPDQERAQSYAKGLRRMYPDDDPRGPWIETVRIDEVKEDA